MLSYHAIGFSQFGQDDDGLTIDFSFGILKMQTFKKLPMTEPNMNAETM